MRCSGRRAPTSGSETFGFVTLAFMALAGFVAIIVFNTVSFESVSTSEETS